MNRRRLTTVFLAPASALAGWAVIRIAGVELVLKSGRIVGPADVFVAALLGALGGWIVARWLAQQSRRPRSAWAFTGSTVLAVSIAGPAWLADGATAVALIALHVTTAVVVITGFAGTLPVQRCGEVPANGEVTRVTAKS